MIKWQPLTEWGQEVSVRTGFTQPGEQAGGSLVGCDQAYEIMWEAVVEAWRQWGLAYRRPHWDEFEAAFIGEPLQGRYDSFFCYMAECAAILQQGKMKVKDFYKQHRGRYPYREELLGCFRNSRLDYALLASGAPNYLRTEAVDMFVAVVPAGVCVVCGDPVYASSVNLLTYAGTLMLSFGYGSLKDCDVGRGLIHDDCAMQLDFHILQQRLNWLSALGDPQRDTAARIQSVRQERLDKGTPTYLRPYRLRDIPEEEWQQFAQIPLATSL